MNEYMYMYGRPLTQPCDIEILKFLSKRFYSYTI